ncbi:MAG: TonB-dependent starch-binding outer membrane protein SusC, partial [Anaerophaga sp.]|nr:TonB-dependent starch-binding outer membrane protein SusC [Anaerophaga sp.]
TNGTVTDIDGNFSLKVADNATIRISYIGYLEQKINTAGKTSFNITLAEDTQALEEVVVVGYGTMKKSDLTGAVVSVSSDDMMKRNPINLGQGLQGAAPGVSVMMNSGSPTGDFTIRIRGIATINNSADPLFVVDGMRVGSNINFLNPNDIESIEILKDASATAIYGSQGANGVVMITTKRGKKDQTSLQFSANYGIQTLSNKLDVMNAEEFVKAARRASASDGSVLTNGAWINYDKELNSIDWQDEMSQTALQQDYNLSVTGGSGNTQAVVSIGYLNRDGIIIASNYKRLTARANIDHKIKDFLRTGVNISYLHSENYGGGNLQNYAAIIPTMDDVDENGNLINVPIQYPDGEWGHFKREGNGDTNKGQDNPVAEARTRDSRNYRNRVVTNAYIDFDIAKGLVFKTIGGLDYFGNSYHGYNMAHERTFLSIGRPDGFSISQNQGLSLSIESYMTYDLNIDNTHHINLMAGYSNSRFKPQDINANASDFPANTIRRLELTNNKSTVNAGGGLGREAREESFFGRVNYSLLDKYLFTGTIRRDGSSNFGAGNRYGTFPSASLAWRVSEEEFIKNLDVFSNMKVRIGWGQTGNAGNSTNLSVDQLSSNRISYYYYVNGSHIVAPGLAQVREIDTNLKWETNEQTNIGLDFGFMNNNFNVSLDYFIRDAKDLLLNRPLRPSTGYTHIYTNAGHIRNSGFEFLLSYQKRYTDWFMNFRLTGSTLNNKAIDVGSDIYFSKDVATGDYWNNYSLTRNGHPVGSFYGWRVDGIFQSQEEIDALNEKVNPENNNGYYQSASTQPGDFKYKDLNNDGWIDDQDREVLGNGYPKINFGFNAILEYKNFDFNLFAHGVLGQKILSYAYKNLTSMYIADGGYRNVLREYAENAWTPENRSNKFPRLTKQDANHNGQVSDAFVKNGDFLKIQNLQVGYTFKNETIKPLNIENLRLFMSVQNLYTFTSYEAGDPEIGTSKVLQTGFDGGRYPFPRTFLFGITLGF